MPQDTPPRPTHEKSISAATTTTAPSPQPLDCASTTRKQIERGQNLNLVTRVRSTPSSREAARQRALKQKIERQAKAAQRTQAAQQREQRREAAAQQRAQQAPASRRPHRHRTAGLADPNR
jgi:hypothetical protein